MIIKAVAGGGGRGMAVVWQPDDLARAYQTTRANAQAVFKDSRVYIERYLAPPRHVEIQILCDAHGNGIHLGERDCSVQRRHQKLIEESPSHAHLRGDARARSASAAVRGALSVGYTGAGTMEFLLDDDGKLYFMEMNARIQVEHPVTRDRDRHRPHPGADPRRRRGAARRSRQEDVELRGHAIECRINAEDPDRDFAPDRRPAGHLASAGRPVDARVDSHCFPGWTVQPVLRLADRQAHRVGAGPPAAIERMDRALSEFEVEGRGVKTTIPLHRRVLAHPDFRSGDVSTDFLEKMFFQESAPA